MKRIRKLLRHLWPCKRCDNTGVIDTGNNDLPCDCVAGDTAIFNCTTGHGPSPIQKTGADLKRQGYRGL